MITVWMLVVIIGEGFSMVPMESEEACRAAASTTAATVLQASCHEIEQLMPSNDLAPELSPIPVKKRGNVA